MGQFRVSLYSLLVLICFTRFGALGAALSADRDEDRVVDLQELLLDVSDGYKKFGDDLKQTLGHVVKSLHDFTEEMKTVKTVLNEVKKAAGDITSVGQDMKQGLDRTVSLMNKFGEVLESNLQKSSTALNNFGNLITDKAKETSSSLNTFGQTIETHHQKTESSLKGFQDFLNEFSGKNSNTCTAFNQNQEKILSKLGEVKELTKSSSTSTNELKTEIQKSSSSINSIVQSQKEIKNTVANIKEVTSSIHTFSNEIKQNFNSCCSSISEIGKGQKELIETITGKLNEVIIKVNESSCKDKNDKDKDDKDKEDPDKDKDDEDKEVINVGEPVQDCADIYRKYGYRTSGVYNIKPLGLQKAFPVLCDMTDGGGWTVIQKRGKFGYPEDYFVRTWENYRSGFGDLDKEFWLGNDRISAVTTQAAYQIKIELWDHDTTYAFARYNNFKVDNERNKYKLLANGYSGNAGDALKAHNNQNFSTRDKDNNLGGTNCAAELNNGGWWYGPCESNLNGWNLKRVDDDLGRGIKWSKWLGQTYSLSATTMKVRPKDYIE